MRIKYPYKSYSEVQGLIDSKGYKNRLEMKDEFPGLYDKCYKSGWMKYLVFPKRGLDINVVISEIQKIVDNENILNPTELKEKHKTEWDRYKRYKLSSVIKFIFKFNNKKWSFLNTLEDFQKFINDNSIKSPSQFEKEYPSAYMRAIDLGHSRKLFYENRTISVHANIETESDAQKFIDENNIVSPSDCAKRFRGFMKKIIRNNWTIVYKDQKKFKSFRWAKTLEDIIEFVDRKDIRSENELTTRYTTLCDYCRENSWFEKVLDYVIDRSKNSISSWEIDMENTLKENLIDFKREVSCVNGQGRFDFLINGTVAIEVQGPTHMWPIYGEDEYIAQRKSDIRKNRWSRENDIKLFYFSYNKHSIVERFGYPYYVYTSEKELIADILKEIRNQTNNTSNGNES